MFVLYDLAGFDGLPVAKQLFGAEIDRLAPFQSSPTAWSSQAVNRDQACSVLRLCENNFRVRLQPDQAALFQAKFAQLPPQRVWLKQLSWLTSLTLSDRIETLSDLVTPKLPHRIAGLQLNCAAPGRIDGKAVLVWRHVITAPIAKAPIVELHLAKADRAMVAAITASAGLPVQSF